MAKEKKDLTSYFLVAIVAVVAVVGIVVMITSRGGVQSAVPVYSEQPAVVEAVEDSTPVEYEAEEDVYDEAGNLIGQATSSYYCTNQCQVEGKKICSGNYVRTCYRDGGDKDPCWDLVWASSPCQYGCSNGACLSAPTCTNECPAATLRRCSNGWEQSCGNWDSDTCLEWGNIKQCSNGCDGATCAASPACTNECSRSGLLGCSSNYERVCGNYDSDACLEWKNIKYCSYGCDGAMCAAAPACTNECSNDGIRQCEGDYAKLCGNWDSDACLEWKKVHCEYGCTSGSCNAPNAICTDECSPGLKACDGFWAYFCGNDDSDECYEIQKKYCQYGCQNGDCIIGGR